MRKLYILCGKPKGKRKLGKRRRKERIIIKIIL
jgi:hypothetical protein